MKRQKVEKLNRQKVKKSECSLVFLRCALGSSGPKGRENPSDMKMIEATMLTKVSKTNTCAHSILGSVGQIRGGQKKPINLLKG